MALGPTGDIVLSTSCNASAPGALSYVRRLNGSGASLHETVIPDLYMLGLSRITRSNDLLAYRYSTTVENRSMTLLLLDPTGQPRSTWADSVLGPDAVGLPIEVDWMNADALGNVFAILETDHPATIDVGLTLLPTPLNTVRGGPAGPLVDDFSLGMPDADRLGGTYFHGNLYNTIDLGCGPLSPPTPGTFVAHVDASNNCLFSKVFDPDQVDVLPEADGGAILKTFTQTPVDLGCGLVSAPPGGHRLAARIDALGNCMWQRALHKSLTIDLDPSGGLLLSALLLGAETIDLGGGPLLPVSPHDVVIGRIDANGNHAFSTRFGGQGVVSYKGIYNFMMSGLGDVYLLMRYAGSIDFGGGPIAAVSGDHVVASFTSGGVHRWSKALDFTYDTFFSTVAYLDGCGALVVSSVDPTFDAGSGVILPPFDPSVPPKIAVARFAP